MSRQLSTRIFRSGSRSFSSSNGGKYLTLESPKNGVAIVRLNDTTSKVNTLNSKMMAEFESMLDTVTTSNDISSVVLISEKKGCFIAGADITELSACSTQEEMQAMSTKGQAFLTRVANSKKPFVAAIDGSCMGGGLEVALACHYRIATESKKTVLALPEVMLGLLPGAGGTQRLPRLVGLPAALPMMLTGANIRPVKAKRMGLVDEVVDAYALEHSAVLAAAELADGSLKHKVRKLPLVEKVIEKAPFGVGVNFAIKKAREMVDKKTGGHYPAPGMILDAVQEGMTTSLEKGLEKEAENFGKLGMTPVAKNLMSIFFGQNELKKNRFGVPEKPVKTMAVLGAGLMGAGIAQVSASKDIRVLLKDRTAAAASKGEDMIAKTLDDKVKKRRMTGYERDTIMSRVIPLSDEDAGWKGHMAKCDLVLEAVFEDLALKHKVVQEMEEIISENCIVATNTSALSVGDIASVSKRPENVIGMHYFSPVPMMPLLEIIKHEKTSDEVAARAVDVGLRQGKTCIVVKDVPGFYVNRCLGPYLAETLALVRDGVPLDALDKMVTKWGMPVGPITLADEVGVDVAAHVNETLSEALGVRMLGGDPGIFRDMITAGLLGKKSGAGFYTHPKSKKEKKALNPAALELVKKYLGTDLKLSAEESLDRMICRFVNEAVLCVQDEIVASPTEGDIGAVFGIGFPPFLGGPFRYVDGVGSTKFNEMMLGFAGKYGEQFTPCPLLQDMAKTNKTFHN